MSNKKQTAVEWLGYELNTSLFYDISPELWEKVNKVFEQALQMEREQMGGAFISGGLNWETSLTFSEYYEKIYGGQDEN